MSNESIIHGVASQIKEIFSSDTKAHDWWHIYRVWMAAKLIAKGENKPDLFIIELAALTHDLGDYKLSPTKEENAAEAIGDFLTGFLLPQETIETVISIVDKVSFSKNVHRSEPLSLEAQIVQDADRLDAIGAIGIARAFTYGGSKGRVLHDPLVKAKSYKNVEERRAGTNTTINHFYEKLLLLKDMLNTTTAKHVAEKRHQYMEQFLVEFYAEWEGKA
jgi:uncharacterized protein